MGTFPSPPVTLSVILRSLDPADDGTTIVIAKDLLGSNFPAIGFAETAAFLDRVLADTDIPNADLKGLLNRETSSAWSMEFGFGSDAKAARRYLEALRRALAQELA